MTDDLMQFIFVGSMVILVVGLAGSWWCYHKEQKGK